MKPRYRFFLYTFITLFFLCRFILLSVCPMLFQLHGSPERYESQDLGFRFKWRTGKCKHQWTDKSTTAQNGSWSVLLDPMSAGGPYTMTVKGTNTVTITDVYIGEVWQCAGQSNMDTRVSYYPHYSSIMNSTNLPKLRFNNSSGRRSHQQCLGNLHYTRKSR